jgi:hypothetical protein
MIKPIYIEEWISLENIVTHHVKKTYLEKIQGTDECLGNKDDNCVDNCEFYYSETNNKNMCVSKNRIKRFQATELSHIITGKNNNDYKILATKICEKKIDGEDVYYHVFLSMKENNIYILFNIGKVFDVNIIMGDNSIKKFLRQLIDTILQEDLSNEQKIIICGHSMGCVFSLITGSILKNNNSDFFDKNIIIIGSAPFKCFNDESFSNLKNVKIFVSCLIENGNEPTMHVDCFVDKGFMSYNYKPLTYIDYKTKAEIDDIDNYKINYVSIVYCKQYHNWNLYYEILKKIYPFNNGGGKITKLKYKNNTKKYKKYKKIQKNTKKYKKIQKIIVIKYFR